MKHLHSNSSRNELTNEIIRTISNITFEDGAHQ